MIYFYGHPEKLAYDRNNFAHNYINFAYQHVNFGIMLKIVSTGS